MKNNTLKLKYGCNPQQKFAELIYPVNKYPLQIINGNPSYINILDSLGAWQVVQEIKKTTGLACAASFKHFNPAGAALEGKLTDEFKKSQFITQSDFSPCATAYARARGCDRLCSYGDFIGVSEKVDYTLANFIKSEVSDGIIAPDYEKEALKILKKKKKESYIIFKMDTEYIPTDLETRSIFGFNLVQNRNSIEINSNLFKNIKTNNKIISNDVIRTLIVSTIVLKYTVSNSIAIGYDGQVIGIATGQQSRIHSTRIACDKAEKWMLQFHPKIMDISFKENLRKPDKTNIIDRCIIWEKLYQMKLIVLLIILIMILKQLQSLKD